jgi:hypothetical protein
VDEAAQTKQAFRSLNETRLVSGILIKKSSGSDG